MHEIIGLPQRTLLLKSGDADTQRTVSALKASARFSLRLSPEAAVKIGTVACFQIDTPINTCVCAAERTVARLGPDEWLLIGPAADSVSLVRELEDTLYAQFFSLVDIGHSNAAIEVAGHHAPEVINGGCPLDLDDASFPPGSATRTLLGKAEIVLLRLGAERIYRIECWRSFAPYVYGLLKNIAREFDTCEPSHQTHLFRSQPTAFLSRIDRG